MPYPNKHMLQDQPIKFTPEPPNSGAIPWGCAIMLLPRHKLTMRVFTFFSGSGRPSRVPICTTPSTSFKSRTMPPSEDTPLADKARGAGERE